MEPIAGKMVTSNLRLVEQLGEGGMGSVWVAEHLGLDTRVAVKFIAADLATKNDNMITRFKREAAIAAKIKSPHVVHIYDHGLTHDGTPYIAMELLEGESLAARLKRQPVMSLRDTAVVVSQTAQVLSHAHRLGVVHRDIKPANLFLARSGYDIFVKVLDFGIARQVDAITDVSVTSTGAMLGSPLFMSPEQFTSAKGVDGRADLWSLAVVAYRALTGHDAFHGETLGQVMMAVMQRGYRAARSLHPQLPGEIDTFFARAFATHVDQRFQSAEELASALLRIAHTSIDTLAENAIPTIERTNDLERTVALPGRVDPPPTPPQALAVQAQPVASTFAPAAATLNDARKSRGRIALLSGAVLTCLALGVGALLLFGQTAERHTAIEAPAHSSASTAAPPPTNTTLDLDEVEPVAAPASTGSAPEPEASTSAASPTSSFEPPAPHDGPKPNTFVPKPAVRPPPPVPSAQPPRGKHGW